MRLHATRGLSRALFLSGLGLVLVLWCGEAARHSPIAPSPVDPQRTAVLARLAQERAALARVQAQVQSALRAVPERVKEAAQRYRSRMAQQSKSQVPSVHDLPDPPK